MTRIITPATEFAIQAHGDQLYGDLPYQVHLFDTVAVLRRFCDIQTLEPALIDAAWLHDVLEDTETSVEELQDRFGERTAALVSAVTKSSRLTTKEYWEQISDPCRNDG